MKQASWQRVTSEGLPEQGLLTAPELSWYETIYFTFAGVLPTGGVSNACKFRKSVVPVVQHA